MAEIINMPRLSDTMEEGTVAKWDTCLIYTSDAADDLL